MGGLRCAGHIVKMEVEQRTLQDFGRKIEKEMGRMTFSIIFGSRL